MEGEEEFVRENSTRLSAVNSLKKGGLGFISHKGKSYNGVLFVILNINFFRFPSMLIGANQDREIKENGVHLFFFYAGLKSCLLL